MKSATKIGWASLLFLVLAGPSPGAVGACGEESAGARAEEFCLEKEALVCERDFARGLLTGEERDQCRAAIPAACERRVWACDPPPSMVRTDACLDALASTDRLGQPTEMVQECNNLCGNVNVAGADGGT